MRLRKVGADVGRLLTSVVGLDEVVLLMGLALIALGCWDWWRPAAYLIPGAVLVWIALPSRQSFIDRPAGSPAPPRRKR